MSETKLMHVPLKKIKENPVALRNVNRTSEDYLQLVQSIKKNGVMNPIVVREDKDPETGEIIYGLIDGLHRFTASHDAGKETIPCHITTMAEHQILKAQIIANALKVETRPVEYSKQIIRILAAEPLKTMSELADELDRSKKWVEDRLGLLKLDEKYQKMVDDDAIKLGNAYLLAKLPVEEQGNFLEQAQSMQPLEFGPIVQARIKQLREAKRQGRDATGPQFVPLTHLRKVSELKDEMEQGVVAKVLTKELNITDPAEAFRLGIQWALHNDPGSLAQQRAKWEAKQKEIAEAAQKRKDEREAKKLKEAQEKAAELKGALAASSK